MNGSDPGSGHRFSASTPLLALFGVLVGVGAMAAVPPTRSSDDQEPGGESAT